MKRRAFIACLGGVGAATAVAPLVARAQQPAMPVIGVLSNDSSGTARLAAFHQGLNEVGYAEGRNVAVEYRSAEDQLDRWAALAADLVRRQVTVIASLSGIPTALAASAATKTIPIVFQGSFDPVQLGIVASLSRPGSNITGISTLNLELGPKRLELLHELVPAATVVGLMVNPTNPNAEIQIRDLRAAAGGLGLRIHVVHAQTERDFETAFSALAEVRAGALVIGLGGPFNIGADRLAAMTLRYAMPAIFQGRDFPVAGGLMSYGSYQPDAFRLAGVYAGRILKGEKPANLPVVQASKVEFVINLKTAKTFGLSVSLPLAGRADEVIE